jgi:hypothetical protein
MSFSKESVEKGPRHLRLWQWAFAAVLLSLLASLLVSGTKRALINSSKTRAHSDIRRIGLSYLVYAQTEGKSRNIQKGINPKEHQASTPAQYAEVLARYADLTLGEIWYINCDDALSGQDIPVAVLSEGKDEERENLLQRVSPVSWAVVVNANKNLTDRYPLLWTRGVAGEWFLVGLCPMEKRGRCYCLR